MNVGADGNDYEVDGLFDYIGSGTVDLRNTIKNEDDEGTYYSPYKFRTTCIDDDSSAWQASYGDVNRYNFAATRPIKMDGFVHTAEGFAKYCASVGTCSGKFTDTIGERAMG